MATAPHIAIYSLKHGQAGKRLETIFDPPQFYALATALSTALPAFLDQETQEGAPIIDAFKEFIKIAAEGFNPRDKGFAWFCRIASEHAEPDGKPNWKAAPEEFDPTIREFLSCAFFYCQRVSKKQSAFILFHIFDIFRQILDQCRELLAESEGEEGKGEPDETAEEGEGEEGGLAVWTQKFDAEVCAIALDRIERLCHYLRLVMKDESEAFSYEPMEEESADPRVRKLKGKHFSGK